MALSIHLANIKSSGIYRFTFDKSLVLDQSSETLRLVVGYSEKGPFNTAMYITSVAQFVEIYGDSTKKLEKRGVYFHRLAQQCLSKGPIICLNLKKFSNETVEGVAFDPNEAPHLDISDVPVEGIYDTSRFWTLSPEQLVDAIPEDAASSDTGYIKVVATGNVTSSCSVIFRPSNNHSYDVTLTEWYTLKGEEMPEYLEPYEDTMVSDYMVTAYIFKGNLNEPVSTLTDYYDYDTTTGEYSIKMLDSNNKDALDTLTGLDSSGYLTAYQGVLIPFFTDLDGSDLSLDLKFNTGNSTHQMMMYMDYELLEVKNSLGEFELPASKLNVSGLNNTWTLDTDDWTVSTEEKTAVFGSKKSYLNVDVKEWDATSGTLGKYVTKADAGNTTFYTTADITAYTGCIYTGDDYSIAMKTTDGDTTGAVIGVGDTCMVFAEGTPGVLVTCTAKEMLTIVDEESTESAEWVKITFDDVVKASGDLQAVVRFSQRPKLTQFSMDYEFTYLEGFTYTTIEFPSTSMYDKMITHKKILSTITDYEGLWLALTSSTDLDYRYIIDTFDSYVEAGLKKTFCQLAQEKGNALFIGNLPGMSAFNKCPYTSFKDDSGNFKTSYIVTGGEGSERFSLPIEADGASFAAYYTPLKFQDGSQKVDIPSAGIVSNNFMDKYTSRQPYYVVAGPNYGRMVYDNLIGPDFNYSQTDRDNLEPLGMNVMLYKPKRGTFINSNQTAKQVPVTALSKVNVRELVIYLQDQIAELLQNYQWEMNTAALRATIKAKADAICTQVQANSGLYAFYNQCDDSNNTSEVIDNEMLVLSTHIEPAKGAGKMVHELTIYNTGAMESAISGA